VSVKENGRFGREGRRRVGAHRQEKQQLGRLARCTRNHRPRRGIDPMCILKNNQERPAIAVLGEMDQQACSHGRTRRRFHLTRERVGHDVDREDVPQQRGKIQKLGIASEQTQNDIDQPTRRGAVIIRHEHALQNLRQDRRRRRIVRRCNDLPNRKTPRIASIRRGQRLSTGLFVY
jgi:hypothetical protein